MSYHNHGILCHNYYCMVCRLFQNYYTQSVDPKNKNRLDFYVAAQKSTRFLMHKNRPDFYCTKIEVGYILWIGLKFYGAIQNVITDMDHTTRGPTLKVFIDVIRNL